MKEHDAGTGAQLQPQRSSLRNTAPQARAALTATCLLQTEAVALSRLGKVYDKVRILCIQFCQTQLVNDNCGPAAPM